MGGGEIGGVVPFDGGSCVGAEIVGLVGHDFFEVGMGPIAVGGVLVDAAPGGVDELEVGGEGLAGHFVEGGFLRQAVFDYVGVEEFVAGAPAGESCVVIGD